MNSDGLNAIRDELKLFGTKGHERIAFEKNGTLVTVSKGYWLYRFVRYLCRILVCGFCCSNETPDRVAQAVLKVFEANPKRMCSDDVSILSRMLAIKGISESTRKGYVTLIQNIGKHIIDTAITEAAFIRLRARTQKEPQRKSDAVQIEMEQKKVAAEPKGSSANDQPRFTKVVCKDGTWLIRTSILESTPLFSNIQTAIQQARSAISVNQRVYEIRFSEFPKTIMKLYFSLVEDKSRLFQIVKGDELVQLYAVSCYVNAGQSDKLQEDIILQLRSFDKDLCKWASFLLSTEIISSATRIVQLACETVALNLKHYLQTYPISHEYLNEVLSRQCLGIESEDELIPILLIWAAKYRKDNEHLSDYSDHQILTMVDDHGKSLLDGVCFEDCSKEYLKTLLESGLLDEDRKALCNSILSGEGRERLHLPRIHALTKITHEGSKHRFILRIVCRENDSVCLLPSTPLRSLVYFDPMLHDTNSYTPFLDSEATDSLSIGVCCREDAPKPAFEIRVGKMLWSSSNSLTNYRFDEISVMEKITKDIHHRAVFSWSKDILPNQVGSALDIEILLDFSDKPIKVGSVD